MLVDRISAICQTVNSTSRIEFKFLGLSLILNIVVI